MRQVMMALLAAAPADGAPPPQAIGKVQTVIGPVTVMGASGVVAQVKVGDPVYRHDTIAGAASSHAAAVPSSDMKSRRLILLISG
jgi:hypothetical protein